MSRLYATCFYDPDGDNICDDDYSSGAGCGTAALLDRPFAASRVTVFVYTVLVDADLTTCGGSTGSVVGNFF